MANVNSFSTLKNKPRELNQGGTSTTETVVTTDGTTVALCPLPTAQQLGGLGTTNASAAFKVKAFGRATAVSATNVTVRLLLGTSTTVASDVVIATTGVVSVTGAQNWYLEATLVWDGTSLLMNGIYTGFLFTTRVAPTTIVAVPTAQNPVTSATQGFCIAGTFGTGTATNTLYVDDISIDIL